MLIEDIKSRFWLLKSLTDLLKLSILRALFPRRRPINPAATPEDLIRFEKEKQEIWTARKLMCDIVHAGTFRSLSALERGLRPNRVQCVSTAEGQGADTDVYGSRGGSHQVCCFIIHLFIG